MSYQAVYADQYGNRILPCKGSSVVISCHTDSVHRTDGKQRLDTSRKGIVSLARKERISNCLGADDVAGVYAALRMIEAGVKATFIFHRDEEHGGRGSAWLAREYPDWLAKFDICLALDRRGTQDIIVAQSWSKCASDEFVQGLAEQLGMGHSKAEGIFTDSANYTDLISECSNLSVGYQHEHSTKERLDLDYLDRVIDKLIAVDWASVPVCRKPGDKGEDDLRWYSSEADYSEVDMAMNGTTFCDYCGEEFKHGYQTLENYQICGACYEAEQIDFERQHAKSS